MPGRNGNVRLERFVIRTDQVFTVPRGSTLKPIRSRARESPTTVQPRPPVSHRRTYRTCSVFIFQFEYHASVTGVLIDRCF